MEATGARRAGASTGHDTDHDRGRTPAQYYCYIFGAVLLLVGLLGFIADATFDTGATADPENPGQSALQGDSFLGFEVNGWHNLVHIASGIFLLALAAKRKTARTAALAFGIVYAVVALIGLIDGNDVLGLIPVNAQDNILHVALSALGIGSALASRADDHEHAHGGERTAPATTA